MTLSSQLAQVEDTALPWSDAGIDPLTALGNRAALTASASGRLSEARAVLLIDIDQFRAVNDTYGHVHGDAVLQTVADRLSSCLDGRHPLFRLGGDEFVVVVSAPDQHGCEELAVSLYDAVREPVQVVDTTLFLEAGVGIALPDGGLTLWELISRAGAAMNRLKESGRLPRVVVFDEAVHGAVLDRFALLLDLRGALKRNELVLDYQPIVDMVTRDPVGFEALLRWVHPTRGLIMPLQFVPLAEDSGLMPEIGEWVLAQACRQARTWSVRSDRPPYLSVNISIRQLEDPSFIDRFRGVLADSGLAPNRLRIEVTESVVAEGVGVVSPLLAELRAMGVGVLLDDFGTGYSSLGYVRELPLDGIKLDRVFSRDLTESAGAWTLARSVVALFRQLGLEIIAEGLETAAHLAQLRSLGCGVGQGFYFARPRPPEALEFRRFGGGSP